MVNCPYHRAETYKGCGCTMSLKVMYAHGLWWQVCFWCRWEGRLGDRKGNSVTSPVSLVFNRRKGRSAEENEGK